MISISFLTDKDDQKESVKLTMAKVDAIRTKCSKFYKYLKHLKMEETAGKESSVKISFDEKENCPVGKDWVRVLCSG